MACYRLSFLTIDGQWRGGHDFECDNDAQACQIAESHSVGWGMQLWRRDILVRSFPVLRQDLAEPAPPAIVATPTGQTVVQDVYPDPRERMAA